LSVTTCLLLMLPRTPPFTLFPYTTLFRSSSSALKQFPFLSQPQYQAMYHNLPGGFAPTQWDLFQPRVGIAYQITRNTVVRSGGRSEEHTSELQSRSDLVCRLLLEKKNVIN